MKPFRVLWSELEVNAVLARVREAKLPPAPTASGWTYGCDADFLERLREYWLTRFDWQAAMARLNRFPQFVARINNLDIHFVHVRGERRTPRPLILTHGWPGSHYEFWHLIEPLAFPSRFGGHAEDAFDVVLPSLPGFAFSGKPAKPMGQRATAAMWNELMTTVLGYPQYLAQGGDYGAIVSSWLGVDHPASVRAIHLNLAALRSTAPPQNDEEREWMNASQSAQMKLGGYATLQMFKPQSLAWLGANNPLGQAAWIAERFHDWSDLRTRDFESVYPLDELLTNIMIYVMTDSFVSSTWYYPGIVQDGFVMLRPRERCETPTAYAAFPGDALLPTPPRSRVELTYNLVRWREFERGGHFAAMECPQEFLQDVREWARECWQ